MTGKAATVRRVAILEREPLASRASRVVLELSAEPGASLVPVLVAGPRDTEALPEGCRDVLVVPGDPWEPDDLAVALAADPPEFLWVGWNGLDHAAAVAETCARLGIRAIGPSAAGLSLLRDADTWPGLMGLDGAAPPGSGSGGLIVEVETLADQTGGVRALGVRGITASRAGEAVLAEAPPARLPPGTETAVLEAAIQLHRGLGDAALASGLTTQFAVDDGTIRPLAVRTAPVPSDAVSEAVGGFDSVDLRLRAALGRTLPDPPPPTRGHGVLGVLRAEDPSEGFRPAEGSVEAARFPGGPGIRVDRGIVPGRAVRERAGRGAVLAAVTAWADSREAALGRLRLAVLDTVVDVPGAATDRSELLREIAGAADTPLPNDGLEIAVLDASIAEYADAQARGLQAFLASAARGRPEVHDEVGQTVELQIGAAASRPLVLNLGPGRYRVRVDARAVDVDVSRLGTHERRLTVAGRAHHVVQVRHDSSHVVEVEGVLHRVVRGAGEVIRAPAPAVVVQALVQPGDEIAVGDPVVVLEAMKMEMSVAAPAAGRVRSIVGVNVQVGRGDTLVELESTEAPDRSVGEPHLELLAGPEEDPGTPDDDCRRTHEALRRLVLGYDVEPPEAADLAARWAASCRLRAADDPQVMEAEDDVLEVFADVLAVASRRAPTGPDAEFLRAPEDPFPTYLRTLDASSGALPESFLDDLGRALRHFGVHSVDRSPELEDAVFRIARSHRRAALQVPAVMAILDRRLEHAEAVRRASEPGARELVDRIVGAAQGRLPAVADLAREVRYRVFDQPFIEASLERQHGEVQAALVALALDPSGDPTPHVEALVASPLPLRAVLIPSVLAASAPADEALLEALVRRYYRIRGLRDVRRQRIDGRPVVSALYTHEDATIRLFATAGELSDLPRLRTVLAGAVSGVPEGEDVLTDYFLWNADGGEQGLADHLRETLGEGAWPHRIRRAVVTLGGPRRDLRAPLEEHFTFRQGDEGFVEDPLYRGLHPMMGKRLDLWRLANFDIERLPSVEDVYLFRAVAKENPKDERLLALAEVRDLTAVLDEDGNVTHLPYLERTFTEALAGIRLYQSHRPTGRRLQWNRVLLAVRPVVELDPRDIFGLIQRMAPLTDGLGLEKVLVRATLRDRSSGEFVERVMHITNPAGQGLILRYDVPANRPIAPLTQYRQRVVRARQRGLVYPYEIVAMLTPRSDDVGGIPPGEFVEHDLDESEARLVPVDRSPGENSASIITGVITNSVPAYPEGMTRVIILGDPTRALGSLAEPECRRIVAALDLAQEMDVPVEWFAVSSGARISMESGTETMDWIGGVLRRLIEFTQAGGEVNVIVCGINVGAQPYWNAEATMLMHTRGILVMTPDGAMVLTGKQALDYSGGVSADDNFGIGGFERVMGPNGQAQYWAADIADACQVLLRHYEHTYRARGERFPRRVPTSDPFDRDVGSSPHRGGGFHVVGEVFSQSANPERKHPFDMRSLMRAVADADHDVLERWGSMWDAETVIVWDAMVGGFPVSLLGIESKPLPRHGPVDADGPEHWTSGTLFPLSSKKAARAINATSGNRPLVVLANLSGFDGSPESLRKVQLEYGAEIGRAVTNFRGPIVFLVVSRYHGGAFVVFSQALNEDLEIAAVSGASASIIGGAPAAAVVFAREVDSRVDADPRVDELRAAVAGAGPDDRARLRRELDDLRQRVRSEKLGEVADEYDAVHDIQRALKVGSVHHVIEPARIRPYLIDAVERGVARVSAR